MDIELARLALKRIETDPDRWNQTVWRCGTTCCFAGHVALAAGATWRVRRFGSNFFEDNVVLPGSDISLHVSDYAQRALHATNEQAQRLFSRLNSLQDLHDLVDEFAEQ